MKFRKTLLAATLSAGFAFASLPASASHIPGISFEGGPFVVNPGAVVGEDFAAFTAGALTFSYTAEVDQSAGTPRPEGPGSPGSTSPFVETGIAQISAFLVSQGGAVIQAGTTGLNLGPGTTGYSLFVEFQGAGTATVNSAMGVDGVFETFNLQFYVDPNNNTTQSCPTAGPPANGFCTRGGVITDDILVLAGMLEVGGFHVEQGLVGGDFDVQFEVTANPSGFFPTIPVGTLGEVAGENACIDISPAPECQAPPPPPIAFIDAIITGSGDGVFQQQQLPEPGTLALLGLALLGAGFSSRRKVV